MELRSLLINQTISQLILLSSKNLFQYLEYSCSCYWSNLVWLIFSKTKQYRLGAMFFFMGLLHLFHGLFSLKKIVLILSERSSKWKLEYKDGPLRLVMSKSHQTETDQKFLGISFKKKYSI